MRLGPCGPQRFDELRADVEEWTDVGDAVIGAVHWQVRGRASGMSIDVRQFDVYEFRDGQIVRATLGLKSKEEALEAAGPGELAQPAVPPGLRTSRSAVLTSREHRDWVPSGLFEDSFQVGEVRVDTSLHGARR